MRDRSHITTTTTILQPIFWHHPGEPVAEEKLLNFMVQGKINRGRHTDHPESGLTSDHLHHPIFYIPRASKQDKIKQQL